MVSANSKRGLIRDGPLENLWGGGGGLQKKYSRKGKLNEKKNSFTAINPENIIHATAYKKFIQGIW